MGPIAGLDGVKFKKSLDRTPGVQPLTLRCTGDTDISE
jgi:hypothetical protein